MSSRDEVEWAPRASKSKIRRLYLSDAQGLLDTDLLDDVGTLLYQRCRSILQVHQAQQGWVTCPRCEKQGRQTVIRREQAHGTRDVEIRCPACGWEISWEEYRLTFKRRQLNSGGALSTFTEFTARWPAARTPEAKMTAVDRLIHAFHYSLQAMPDLPTRPAGVNLIDGKVADVIAFLNELSFGPGSTPGLSQTRAEWQQALADFENLVDKGLEGVRRERGDELLSDAGD